MAHWHHHVRTIYPAVRAAAAHAATLQHVRYVRTQVQTCARASRLQETEKESATYETPCKHTTSTEELARLAEQKFGLLRLAAQSDLVHFARHSIS